MADIQGAVLGVIGSPTRNGNMRYKVAFSDGNEYTTFDNAKAKKANGLANQQGVTLRVNVGPSRDGRFTNYDLIDVAAPGEALPPSDMMDQAGAQVGADGIPIVQPQQRRGGGGGGRGGMTPEDKMRVTQLACLGTAYAAVFGLFQGAGPEAYDEANSKALELAKSLFDKVMPTAAVSQPVAQPEAEPVVPTEQTPEAVAAAVNQAAGTDVVATGAAQTPTPQW